MEERNAFAAALVAFQSEVGAVAKNSNNPFFKSKYAALPDVVAHATPILAKHGLAVTQTIGYDSTAHGVIDTLTTTLLHTGGYQWSETMRLHLTKDDPQGQGSAITYARRYAFMAILGLVADEDDDGNAASKPVAKQTYAPREQHNAPRAGEEPFATVTKGITAPQSKALFAILKGRGLDIKQEVIKRWGKDERSLTAAEASAWIDELNGGE